MFERIVVAVDGSRPGSKTVPVAVDLAAKYGSSVIVVHMREHGRYAGADVDLGPAIGAEELVAGILATFREAGITAEGEIRRGSPGETPEQIVRVAKESKAELIIMGSRGMTEWKSLLLGGVATKVVHHAECPVLLVR